MFILGMVKSSCRTLLIGPWTYFLAITFEIFFFLMHFFFRRKTPSLCDLVARIRTTGRHVHSDPSRRGAERTGDLVHEAARLDGRLHLSGFQQQFLTAGDRCSHSWHELWVDIFIWICVSLMLICYCDIWMEGNLKCVVTFEILVKVRFVFEICVWVFDKLTNELKDAAIVGAGKCLLW